MADWVIKSLLEKLQENSVQVQLGDSKEHLRETI